MSIKMRNISKKMGLSLIVLLYKEDFGVLIINLSKIKKSVVKKRPLSNKKLILEDFSGIFQGVLVA